MTAAIDDPTTAGTVALFAEAPVISDELVQLARDLTAGTLGPLPTLAEFEALHPDSSANRAWLADPHGLYARMNTPDFGTWMHNAGRAGGCTNPIRLTGGTTTIRLDRTMRGEGKTLAVGHVVDSFDTSALPEGLLYKPCGTRRASLCPACAERYRYDTYQLIRAGIAGGKGVPDTVTDHPAVFLTLTAPSFGLVHSGPAHEGAAPYRCRPRRDLPVCEHGRPAHCSAIHRPGDPIVGQPLCMDCYDYEHAVIWNHFAPRLWDRTLTLLRRDLGEAVKVRYAKVAEFQRRGAVHLHAVLRLDGYDDADPQAILTPPPWITVEDLVSAIEHAAATAGLRTPAHPDRLDGWPMVWGDQGKKAFADVKVIRRGIPGATVTEQHVAGYLAKYATKGAEATGTPTGRLTDDTVDLYADHAGNHTARLLATCWHLGRPTLSGEPLTDRPRPQRPATHLGELWKCGTCGHTTRLKICLRCDTVDPDDVDPVDELPAPAMNPFVGLRRWAHMLGFGGHFSTKSRQYSTTLRQLRADRATHATAEARPTALNPTDISSTDAEETTLVIRRWNVVGFGWKTSADAALAALAADAARQRRASLNPAA